MSEVVAFEFWLLAVSFSLYSLSSIFASYVKPAAQEKNF
jgi:hypothetical protein